MASPVSPKIFSSSWAKRHEPFSNGCRDRIRRCPFPDCHRDRPTRNPLRWNDCRCYHSNRTTAATTRYAPREHPHSTTNGRCHRRARPRNRNRRDYYSRSKRRNAASNALHRRRCFRWRWNRRKRVPRPMRRTRRDENDSAPSRERCESGRRRSRRRRRSAG